MPKLVLNAGTPQAQEYNLKPGKNYVGRAFANDFKLDDASVSGSHAVVIVNGATVTITDLGSTNGTRINQLPATGNPLQAGQIVKLGAVELLFVADVTGAAPPPPIAPPPNAEAVKIATEFIIREPSHVAVAPPAPPPPTPAPAPVLKIPGAAPGAPPAVPPAPVAAPALKIPAPAPNIPPPPPAPVPPAPAPIPQPVPTVSAPRPIPQPIASAPATAQSVPPPPPPVVITSAAPVSVGLKIPAMAPTAPASSADVLTPPPPQKILIPSAPPPPPTVAAAAAEAPPAPAVNRLALSGASHAPIAAAAPALAAPATGVQVAEATTVTQEPVETPAGLVSCKFHRTTSGEWLCQKCTQLFCSLCVVTRPIAGGMGHFCRACGTQCVPVKMKAVAKKKERQLVAHSDGTIVMRTIGFGLGAAVLGGALWAGSAKLIGTDFPFIAAAIVGTLCGFAVKFGSQDRPGGFFSGMAVLSMVIGVALGKLGAYLLTGLFVINSTQVLLAAVGILLGAFLAWKIGGGDF